MEYEEYEESNVTKDAKGTYEVLEDCDILIFQ